jgi:hypothetical protein
MRESTESLITTKTTANQPYYSTLTSLCFMLGKQGSTQGFQQTMLRKGVRMNAVKELSESSQFSNGLQTNFREWR